MDRYVNVPLSEKDAHSLKAGDYVYLTGTIYTARDAAHKRMQETLDRGEELPLKMENNVIYYMGPSPAREGRQIGSAGPTTCYISIIYNKDLVTVLNSRKSVCYYDQGLPCYQFCDRIL